jgi:hypothetical protein
LELLEEENPKYHKLNLEEKHLKIIENQFDLLSFLDELYEKSIKDVGENRNYYVGVDTEWLPTCAMGLNVEDKKKVALIQVATQNMIYLLDMVKLSECIDEHISQKFSKMFLYNKKIVKVGYGFTQDIKMICQAFINVTETDFIHQSSLDLAYLVGQVTNKLLVTNIPCFQIRIFF